VGSPPAVRRKDDDGFSSLSSSLLSPGRASSGSEDALSTLRGGAYDGDDDSSSEEYHEYDSESEDEDDSEECSDSSDDDDDDDDSSESESSSSEGDEYDSDSEGEESSSSEAEEESDDEAASAVASARRGSTAAGRGKGKDVVVEYDEMLVQGPFESMGVTMGIMLLSKRIDLNDPKIVRIARFAFIAYLVVTQIFLAYVRIKARQIDDRTPITIQNPLNSVLQSQLQQGGDMAKNLASSFLSSETTAVEYDLKQAKNMGNGLLMPMAFLWVLHFKMGQTQPVLLQTASGFANLVYSPLFQVYVLGRNLERPFKSKNAPPTSPGAEGEGEEEGKDDGAEPVAEDEEETGSEEEEGEWTASDESGEEYDDDESGDSYDDSDEYDSDEE